MLGCVTLTAAPSSANLTIGDYTAKSGHAIGGATRVCQE